MSKSWNAKQPIPVKNPFAGFTKGMTLKQAAESMKGVPHAGKNYVVQSQAAESSSMTLGELLKAMNPNSEYAADYAAKHGGVEIPYSQLPDMSAVTPEPVQSIATEAYVCTVEGYGGVVVHPLPEKHGNLNLGTPEQVLIYRLKRLGVKLSDSDLYSNGGGCGGDNTFAALAEELQEGRALKGDLAYARMLLDGIIGTLRQTSNLVQYGQMSEAREALKHQEEMFKSAREFVSNTNKMKTWATPVYIKKTEARTTLSLTEPKQKYDSTKGEYVWPDGLVVQQSWMIKTPLVG